jgi:pimeloyl-ACP methyl ester carboxylesterase
MGDEFSEHTPVLILHGGMGNSNQMFRQANMLAHTRRVILQEYVAAQIPPFELMLNCVCAASTRGEGRSPYRNFTLFHYDDFARDAIAVLDHLRIPRVAVFGWSDGAITGINLAMNYSSRIDRVFAHGANIQANMSIPGLDDPIINSDTGSLDSDFATNGTTYATTPKSLKRRTKDGENPYTCESLSPTPDKCAAMQQGIV